MDTGLQGGYILWSTETRSVRIIHESQKPYEQQGVNDKFYYLPLNAVEEYHFQSPEESVHVLNYIETNEK